MTEASRLRNCSYLFVFFDFFPIVFGNTPAIEMGLENYTEGEMVLKKMTDDMIEETGDDSYYENFQIGRAHV